MIDIVPDKKIVKINATIDDDINLILDAIVKVDAAFILLVLPQGNDLINSPIGLKALRKKTYEKGKRMILVVPQGAAYELTKKAGFIATTTVDQVTSDLWQTAMQQYDEYYHGNVGMNSKKNLPKSLENKVEYMNPINDKFPVPEIISGGTPVEKAAEPESKPESTPFSSKAESNLPPTKPFVEKTSRLPDPKQNVTGMDFAKMVKNGNFGAAGVTVPKKQPLPSLSKAPQTPIESNPFNPDIIPKKIGVAIGKVPTKSKNPLLGIAGFLIGGIVVALLGMFAVYYIYFPSIRIELFVQASALSLTDSAFATSAVTGFDVNRKEIQLTKEKVEKNATVTFTATKQGAEGTKAVGTIGVKNTDAAAKTVPVGTLVSSGTKKFVVTGAAGTIPGKDSGAYGYGTMSVTAVEFGEEFNLPIGSTFTVTGFSTLTGENTAAFSGGTKRTFVVVGQEDVDKAVKALQAELEKQAVSDLEYMNLDKGYEFIKSSVKTEIKDKVVVTPAVGTEVKASDEDPTIALFVNTTGLYYHKESLTRLAEKLLLEKYRADKALSDEDIARTTIEDQSLKIDKVTLDKNEKVTVAFTAKGLATSRIDTAQVKNDVVGKKWAEMLETIRKMPTLSIQKQPVVKFFPSWIPENLWYVPKEVGRVDVSVKVVAPEDTVSQ